MNEERCANEIRRCMRSGRGSAVVGGAEVALGFETRAEINLIAFQTFQLKPYGLGGRCRGLRCRSVTVCRARAMTHVPLPRRCVFLFGPGETKPNNRAPGAGRL